MSPQQLQRMIVRMMYDPNLVEEVYSGNPVDGLDDHARDLLCASDRRAWGSDPYRRARSLRGYLPARTATGCASCHLLMIHRRRPP